MREEIDGYEDLADIGGGGFSRVYRARDLVHDRTVAIKILDTRGATDSERRAFERELRAMGRIGGHPHAVPVLESGFTETDRPYLVMPFFEAGTFADELRRSGPLPVSDVLDLGIKIASALETVHQLGYVHRDVKPANIFVGDFGGHAIGDFGISSFTDGSAGTRTVGVALTPAHAAPEVWEDETPTTLTDVYSLGSTLYTLLAGSPPFASDSHAGLLRKVLSEAPPRISRDDVPVGLRSLLDHMLAKEATGRPESALDVATALRDLQVSQGLAATPVTVKGWTATGSAAPVAPVANTPPAADGPRTVTRDQLGLAEPDTQEPAPTPEPQTPLSPSPDIAPTDATEIRSPLQRPGKALPSADDSPAPAVAAAPAKAGPRRFLGAGLAVVALIAVIGWAVVTRGESTGVDTDDPANAAVQDVDPDDIGPVLIANDPTNLELVMDASGTMVRWDGATNPNVVYEVMVTGTDQIAETPDLELNLDDEGLVGSDDGPVCVSVRVTTQSPARVGEWVDPVCSAG